MLLPTNMSCLLALLFLALELPASLNGHAMRRQGRPLPVQQTMDGAVKDFEFDGDDALAKFLSIEKDRSADKYQKQMARYYAGRCYFRDYYRYQRISDLDGAYTYFHRYITSYNSDTRKHPPDRWLADDRFYKSLYYLQMEKLALERVKVKHPSSTYRDLAYGAIGDLKPPQDSYIYVDYLVYSKDQKYSINRSFSSVSLQAKMLQLINLEKYQKEKLRLSQVRQTGRQPKKSFDEILDELKKWCIDQGNSSFSEKK